MASVVRTETRKRGIVGWIFLLLFWAFNAFMAFAIFAGISGNAAKMEQLTTEAQKTAFGAGTALGVGMLVMVWAAGAVILGLFVLFTKGRKVIVETTVD